MSDRPSRTALSVQRHARQATETMRKYRGSLWCSSNESAYRLDATQAPDYLRNWLGVSPEWAHMTKSTNRFSRTRRSRAHALFLLLSIAGIGSSAVAACSPPFTKCEDTRSCAPTDTDAGAPSTNEGGSRGERGGAGGTANQPSAGETSIGATESGGAGGEISAESQGGMLSAGAGGEPSTQGGTLSSGGTTSSQGGSTVSSGGTQTSLGGSSSGGKPSGQGGSSVSSGGTQTSLGGTQSVGGTQNAQGGAPTHGGMTSQGGNSGGTSDDGGPCTNYEAKLCSEIFPGIASCGGKRITCSGGHWPSAAEACVPDTSIDCSSTDDNDCDGTPDREASSCADCILGTYKACYLSDPQCIDGATECIQEGAHARFSACRARPAGGIAYTLNRLFCGDGFLEGSPCITIAGKAGTLTSKCSTSPSTCGFIYCVAP